MSTIIAREPFARKSIAPGMRVTLHFSLLLADGREVDTTRRGKPVTCVIGDGNLPAAFEQVLLGLQPADDAQFPIAAADAFGPRREENLRWFPRDRFVGMTLEPGLVVSFTEPGGELPGVVLSVGAEAVQVDFNHPLAGQDLLFDVSIIAVGDHSSPEDYRSAEWPS